MANDLTGTATYTAGAAKFGSAGWASGLLTAPTAADSFFASAVSGSAIGTGTAELWIKTTASGATQVAAGRGGAWWVGIAPSNSAQAAVGSGAQFSGGAAINDGAWHHLALVVTAGVGSLYVDGTRVAVDGAARTVESGAASNFYIGSFNSGGSFAWAGSVDEVRISTTARYSGTSFTAPTAAFTDDGSTSALWHLDGNGTDAHGAGGDTTPPTVPGTPTATAGNTTATVTFSGSTDAVGVVGYRVYSSADSYTAVAASGSASPITVTGLTNGTAYTFKVSAYDAAANESAKSAASNSVTPAAAVTIAPNDTNIVYSPYNWDVTSGRALTNCAGAYFRTLIGGTPTAVTLNFDVSSLTGTFPTLLWYRVDGGAWTQATVAATVAVTLPGATGNWTKRLVEVVIKTTTESVNRWASPYATAAKFTGITTTPGTCTTVAVQPRSIRGVVFGDSITEGINVLGSAGDTTVRSDALLSYAYALRDALGAEVGVVGFGAQGLSVGGNGSVPVFGSAWNLQAASITRSFATAPDFVVINQGQNDGSTDITAAYTSVLNAMISAFPSTTKLFAMRPFTGTEAARIQAAIAACTAPTRVTYVDTTGWWSTADSADSVHPYGYSDLTQLAPRLAAAIKTVIGGGGSGSGRYVNVGGTAKLVGTVVKA